MQDFFSSHMRNPNTRRAYRGAVRQFSAFCAEHGIVDLAEVEPMWRRLSRCSSSCTPDDGEAAAGGSLRSGSPQPFGVKTEDVFQWEGE